MFNWLRKLFSPAPARVSSYCTCIGCGRAIHQRDSGVARFHYDGSSICSGSGHPGKELSGP